MPAIVGVDRTRSPPSTVFGCNAVLAVGLLLLASPNGLAAPSAAECGRHPAARRSGPLPDDAAETGPA
jgi:hypothetical protein